MSRLNSDLKLSNRFIFLSIAVFFLNTAEHQRSWIEAVSFYIFRITRKTYRIAWKT